MKLTKTTVFVLFILLSTNSLLAQNYHAVNGSPYAGISNTYYNPATSVNSFYKWDVSLFGAQHALTNNLFTLSNFSAANPNANIADTQFAITPFTKTRSLHSVTDGQLLSFRVKLGDKRAMGVSFRMKNMMHITSSNAFVPTENPLTLQGFLQGNLGKNQPISFNGIMSSWAELTFNYSQIVQETQFSRLSAGINVSYMKGLAGMQFFANNLQYTQNVNSTTGNTYYTFTNGSVGYMYSDNLRVLDSLGNTAESRKQYLSASKNSIGFSIGAEYLVKESYDGEPLNTRNYDWKFGISIMDIGANYYKHVRGSATNKVLQNNVTDTAILQELANIGSISRLRDSISDNFVLTNYLNSDFSISNPTRLVLNVDRNLGNHFYVNASLGINFYSTKATERGNTKEISFLTLTPRFETQLLGFYLPIQYNSQYNLWVGAAAKIGPLTIGVHDFGVFKWFKNNTQNFAGGGYVMLNIYPYRNTSNDGVDCPKIVF
ncbi:MAG: hypothetical protein ACOVMM_10085 [Chitinophagaceae bacterium]